MEREQMIPSDISCLQDRLQMFICSFLSVAQLGSHSHIKDWPIMTSHSCLYQVGVQSTKSGLNSGTTGSATQINSTVTCTKNATVTTLGMDPVSKRPSPSSV